ncbi:MAG: hypothetical protein ABSE62_05190 [Chthoniobacteraceae bacterium]
MKSIVRYLLLAGILSSFAVWAAGSDGGSLFHSNEGGVSVFGESANGNVDSQPTQTTVITTYTVTTSTVVAAPTAAPSASPSGSPPPDDVKKLSKKALKFATGGKLEDPTVTKTFSSKRFVSHDRIEHNAGGGGVELSYFFTRYIGLALEGDFLGGNEYNTAVTGNLIFRYPFDFGAKSETSGYSKDGKDGKTVMTGPTWGLAPYVLMGGGGQWDGQAAGVGVVGGGVEFRFKEHYGFFLEGRWVIHDARQNYAAETAGFDYSF